MQAAARGLVACQQHDATRRLRIAIARPVLPRITLRTYVRTYALSSSFLSASFPRVFLPFHAHTSTRRGREREGEREIVNERARVCARVCVCAFLSTPRRDSSFFSLFYRVFQSFASQCANIINGKVPVYVIGRIVQAKGCAHGYSPGYSHFCDSYMYGK